MMKNYYLREKGKNIPYSFDELKSKNLKKHTKIWIEGASSWQRLDRIPELNEITNKIPPENTNWNAITVIFLILIGCIIIGYGFYYQKMKSNELKAISSQELYNNYESSVVLIKHSFLYKIQLGDNTYYFKNFDPETGEVDGLKEYSELKNDPNTIWGTGFFIDSNGSVLTNRHVVRTQPTKEEQQKILNYLKQEALIKINEYSEFETNIENRLYEIDQVIRLRYSDLTTYEYDRLNEESDELNEKLEKAKLLKLIYTLILDQNSLPTNFVSKTSLEFGIFLNKDKSKDYKNYIKYKVDDVSEDENIDLALLIPSKQSDIESRIFKTVDLSLFDSIKIKPRKMYDEVKMIGFNRGNQIAETTNGINSQLTEGNISQINDSNKILYTIPALQGSSGSPIFDKYGRLISVNFAGFSNTQSFNYGIQTKKLQEYLIKVNKVNPKL